MAEKVIDTNPHLKTRKDRIEQVARSQSASQGIEDIKVSTSKIKQILNQKESSVSSRRK